jgi:RNA polymerase primary sigma factor
LRDISRYSLLKHEDSVALFQKYEAGRQVTDEGKVISVTPDASKAKKVLIESNLRLVISIAKAYKNTGVSFEDLVQEGNLGLIRSIDMYDWKKGFRFSTYASWWVKQSIGQHVMKRKRTIRMPAHALGVQKKLITATEEYKQQFDVEPTIEELAKLTGASEKMVRATLESCKRMTSLHEQVSMGSDDKTTLEDTIPDETPTGDPFGIVMKKEMVDVMRRVLDQLTPKEAAILRLRFGLIEDPTDHVGFPITEIELEGVVLHRKGLE